uniref:NIDO domain-containing protein n=1 Tax=Heterorhabditis bacteriophora TaxID=37862 RepID=A0A1I7WSV0_HETBA
MFPVFFRALDPLFMSCNLEPQQSLSEEKRTTASKSSRVIASKYAVACPQKRIEMWAPMMAFLPLLTAMRLDPERIAARLRIEESMDSSIRSDRGRRQLQPKEINIQVNVFLTVLRLIFLLFLSLCFYGTKEIFVEKENCHARASAQCAPNAISFTDYDRCGEPLQRCQCLSGFSGDGYKSCHGRCLILYITSSGLISLSDITRTSGEHLEEMHMTGIAPFFAPIDTSKSGHVTVAEVTDTDTLNRLTRTISENYPDLLFQTKNALIVTHINVTDGKSQGNTFQTLIVSGTNKKRDRLTFVELLYKDMTWGDGAEAGIITNDLSGSVTLPGSGTQGIEQLTQLSNIKQPGIWLFRIDEPIISPCPKSNQLPPYCEETHSTSTEGLTKSIQKFSIILILLDYMNCFLFVSIFIILRNITLELPSPSLSPSPSFQPHSASSPHPAILSENLDHRSEDLTIGVPVGEPKIIQPNIIPNFPNMQTSFATAAVEKTTFKSSRPRPRFESTSHRPIVSLVDKDFEEIDPDVFEITFPPFVTVIPEIFTPQRRKEATTSRALPDFTLAQQLQSTMRSSPTTTSELTFPTLNNDSLEETILNAPQTKYQHQLETTTELDKSTESMTTTFEHEEENDVEEETESTEVTAIPTSKTSYKEIHEELVVTPEVTSVATTSNQPIFVFTTSKPIPKSIPKKPQIVTAPTTTTSSNVSEAETAASSDIFLVYLLKISKSSRGHLHAGYGPTFTVQPTSYALKRGSKHLDSSYEDHLEKAARLSSEMTAYNQVYHINIPSHGIPLRTECYTKCIHKCCNQFLDLMK